MIEAGKFELGMIGLGTMGENLLLNMADHGFNVAGYDRDSAKVAQLAALEDEGRIVAVATIEEFVALLRLPRAVMLLVPAGSPVDAVIAELLPLLTHGDLIIDAGNSNYRDTALRHHDLEAQGIGFLGVGVSGGEAGARLGPSIMPGGAKESYERVRPIFEAVAARVQGEPCVTWLGPGAAGHYVKMVHNGIEYGIMQLIAESYDLLKRGCGFTNAQLHETFASWNSEKLQSYLIEITANIFAYEDAQSGETLLDEIVGIAEQNGTGEWTSQSGFELQIPTPTINAAVGMRDMSVLIKERTAAAKLIGDLAKREFPKDFVGVLESALFGAILITYTEGFALLHRASKEFKFNLNLSDVAKIWRGGCIIRARVLEEIRTAFESNSGLPNLLLAPKIASLAAEQVTSLRGVVGAGAASGIPLPAFMSALAYFDAYRSVWTPANLIQAQRDYFGAHHYALIGKEGSFHTEWMESASNGKKEGKN